MGPSETFVVRIYRRGRGGAIAGIVESIASGLTHRFASFGQLRAILDGRRPSGKDRRQTVRTGAR